MEKLSLVEALLEELSIILDASILAETDLPAEAGLDSFGTMQVIVFLEERFGIAVPEDNFDISNFSSVEVIAQWALPMINAR